MLANVDILNELSSRPRRASRIEDEHRAFTMLAAEMAANPRNMLQKLAELAVDVCDAHTAGISLLDGDVFRWEAVAGVLSRARGETMPREQSPCGICIDRNATQLMRLPDRAFPALPAEPRFVETMLIPFHSQGTPIGTVWLVSHTPDRQFDREDERFVLQLSQFASSGWQMLRAGEQLSQLNRRKDEFLAMLGHELRSPLGAIFTATALVSMRVGDDAVAASGVDMIMRQARHLRRLADDLLDIERIESGKLQLARRPVDARAIVSDSVAANRVQIDRRHHALTLDLGDAPVVIEADPTRLAQIVSNLVDNATKYTPENGRIAVRLLTEGGQVVVTVRDSGVGIPADRTAQIFEPFSQLGDAGRRSNGGLGLGLALVKSLTEMHGGTVAVTSNGDDEGSCFSIRLPIVAAQLSRDRSEEVFFRPREDRRSANPFF
jgi:signal transduction histidine kinase